MKFMRCRKEKREFFKCRMKPTIDCSASIVVYNNSPQLLRAAVESFFHCSLKTHLCVVDNSPQPHLKSTLDGLPLDYHFYGSNVGYGKAHNWSIEHGKESRFHLIMNPDIVITPGTMERLIEFMDKNPGVGIASPRVINENGTGQFLNKRYPNVLDLFARRFLPYTFSHLLKRRMDRYEMRDVGYEAICDVEVASGAFMLCRTEVLKALAGFDPRYFLYFEDFDLSRKFQQRGYRTVYYPDATVIHFWERAAHKNIRMTLIFIANMYRYFNKWGWKWL